MSSFAIWVCLRSKMWGMLFQIAIEKGEEAYLYRQYARPSWLRRGLGQRHGGRKRREQFMSPGEVQGKRKRQRRKSSDGPKKGISHASVEPRQRFWKACYCSFSILPPLLNAGFPPACCSYYKWHMLSIVIPRITTHVLKTARVCDHEVCAFINSAFSRSVETIVTSAITTLQ